jgi:hypothetical protein
MVGAQIGKRLGGLNLDKKQHTGYKTYAFYYNRTYHQTLLNIKTKHHTFNHTLNHTTLHMSKITKASSHES